MNSDLHNSKLFVELMSGEISTTSRAGALFHDILPVALVEPVGKTAEVSIETIIVSPRERQQIVVCPLSIPII